MMLKNEVHLDVRGVYRYARDLWGCHVVRIDTLVLLNAFAYVFLATFGPQRRRSRNWFIQKGTLVANTLSFLLGTYTLGSMQSSKVKSSMYPFWATTLFILHVCTNTAYSLDDNKHVRRVLYRFVLYNVYVGLLLMTAIENGNSLPFVASLYMFAQSKFSCIQAPCLLVSRSWNLNKTVADYMYDEHTKGEFVPTTMKGCHYLVDWPLDNSKLGAPSYASRFTTSDGNEVIDIEKIWLCDDISLDNELKDTCLSFSLFLLLRRRYFGFACGESKERAHDFVFNGLLRENEDGTTDCNRAFRLIEVELAFMYDFFFTTSAAIYYGSRAATVLSLCSAFYLCLTIPGIVVQPPSPIQEGDMTISLFMLASAALLELLQLLLYWTSIWSRVSFVCQYLREQARFNTRGSCCSCSTCCCRCVLLRLKGLLAKIGVHWTPNKHYWQHKLGQYSLLDYRPKLCDKFKYYFGRLTTSSPILHPIDYHTWRVRRQRGKSTEITAQIQKALISSLKRSNGALTNGKSSLVSIGAGHLLWACERAVHSESDTSCIILTWHIATWYCERGMLGCSPRPDEETELKVHLGVATKLSKYCAYLLVSAPKLLPGHEYDTSRVFDAVAGEAKKFLPYVTDKYQALKNYGLEESEATIFQSGAKLGKQLDEIEDDTRRWKVLADFWSEMLLYIAPSDNVDEHIEQLTRGGEFITHLWALLSHAGILRRDQPNLSSMHAENTEGSSARHQESEQNSTNREENTQDNSARARHQEIEQDSANREENTQDNYERARHQEVEQDSADREEATPPADHPVQMPDNLLSTGLDLQVPSPCVQARPLQTPAPEISTENECHIDVPEAAVSRQQTLREQVTHQRAVGSAQ